MPIALNYLIGVCLVALGIVAIVFGNKKVEAKEGTVLKLLAMPRLNALVLKLAVGLLSIWFGLGFLFGGIKI